MQMEYFVSSGNYVGLEWQALWIKLFKVLLFPAYSSPLLPLDL